MAKLRHHRREGDTITSITLECENQVAIDRLKIFLADEDLTCKSCGKTAIDFADKYFSKQILVDVDNPLNNSIGTVIVNCSSCDALNPTSMIETDCLNDVTASLNTLRAMAEKEVKPISTAQVENGEV